ncbi:MAG: ABC transporter permease [Proteobacteria bacterium]|nr:ABC transporter permease [Pseudomonadota bacterium]MBU1686614.1 ABC transporter permease [Pseudomonadota bacterium]
MPEKNILSIHSLAWKSVTRKLFRNIVLVLAVCMLVALLVFALLFDNAVREDIEEAARKLGADLVLVPAEAKSIAEEFILESKEKTFYMDSFVLESIGDLPEIANLNSHIYLETLESGCCSIEEGQVVVFDPENDFVVKPWLVSPPEHPLGEGEIYVGSYVYEYLGLINTASLFGEKVKVINHLAKTGTGLDHGIFMRKMDLDKITKIATGANYKQGDLSIIFVKLKEGADLEEVYKKIQSINPRIGIMTRGTIGADVRSTLKDMMKVFTITITISALLAILLAWSTFTALANERRREVGILQALGAGKGHIVMMFLAEAAIISLFGGVLGVLFGHLLLNLLAADFTLMTRLGEISITSVQSILLSLIALGLGCGVCLIGAVIPVFRLAQLEPLLALKEE